MKSFIKVIIFLAVLLMLAVVTGCNSEWKKKELFNIRFQVPSEWTIEEISIPEENEPLDAWVLHIPDYQSSISIDAMETLETNEDQWKKEDLEYIMEFVRMGIIDGSTLEIAKYNICGHEFNLFSFFRPEQYEDDFYNPAMNVIEISFINNNYAYWFQAYILDSEMEQYDNITGKFSQILESIDCK
jgi:hypothetical protein